VCFVFLIFVGNKFSLFSSLQDTFPNLYFFILFCYIRDNVSFRLGEMLVVIFVLSCLFYIFILFKKKKNLVYLSFSL
jgi:hypothetical protein